MFDDNLKALADLKPNWDGYGGHTIGPGALTVAGLLRMLSLGGTMKGIVFFMSFFMATSLYLLPMLIFTPWMKKSAQGIGRAVLLCLGIFYLILSLP